MRFNPDDLYDKLEENDRKCLELLPGVIQHLKNITHKNLALSFLTARATVALLAILMDIPEEFMPGALQTILDMHKKIKTGMEYERESEK